MPFISTVSDEIETSVKIINYYSRDKIKYKKLALFDLDDTLIPYSNTNKRYYKLLYNQIENKLQQLHQNNFFIGIVSNQLELRDHEYIEHKINWLKEKIKVPFLFICALKRDEYRKPSIGMFKHLVNLCENEIDYENSFFVGDAAGRTNKNISGLFLYQKTGIKRDNVIEKNKIDVKDSSNDKNFSSSSEKSNVANKNNADDLINDKNFVSNSEINNLTNKNNTEGLINDKNFVSSSEMNNPTNKNKTDDLINDKNFAFHDENNNILNKNSNNGFIDNTKYINQKTSRSNKVDHSDCDLKFAINANLKFYTPEEYFFSDELIPTIKQQERLYNKCLFDKDKYKNVSIWEAINKELNNATEKNESKNKSNENNLNNKEKRDVIVNETKLKTNDIIDSENSTNENGKLNEKIKMRKKNMKDTEKDNKNDVPINKNFDLEKITINSNNQEKIGEKNDVRSCEDNSNHHNENNNLKNQLNNYYEITGQSNGSNQTDKNKSQEPEFKSVLEEEANVLNVEKITSGSEKKIDILYKPFNNDFEEECFNSFKNNLDFIFIYGNGKNAGRKTFLKNYFKEFTENQTKKLQNFDIKNETKVAFLECNDFNFIGKICSQKEKKIMFFILEYEKKIQIYLKIFSNLTNKNTKTEIKCLNLQKIINICKRNNKNIIKIPFRYINLHFNEEEKKISKLEL